MTERKPDFVATIPWHDAKVSTLAIWCSDCRFQQQFDQFLRAGLGAEAFDKIAVPGGPQFLLDDDRPKFGWAGRRWLRFLVEHHEIKTVVCIGHEDCGWYKDLTGGALGREALNDAVKADLARMPEAIRADLPQVEVRPFFASIARVPGPVVIFEAIA